MGTILVPYDGSAGAKRALRYAREAYPDEKTVLLYVVELGTGAAGMPETAAQYYQTVMENAEELVAEAASDDELVTGEVTAGRPAHAILEFVAANDISHIVMGNRGRDGTARVLLGSVAEAVVRRSPVPTTIVRKDSPERPESVLVAFDGSEEAMGALEFALSEYDAEVTALFVVHPSQTLTERLFRRTEETVDDWETEREERTTEVFDAASAIAEKQGKQLTCEFREGEPAKQILSYLDEHPHDHVVAGSRGRDGVERILFGSTAERIVRRAPVSVTVVR